MSGPNIEWEPIEEMPTIGEADPAYRAAMLFWTVVIVVVTVGIMLWVASTGGEALKANPNVTEEQWNTYFPCYAATVPLITLGLYVAQRILSND